MSSSYFKGATVSIDVSDSCKNAFAYLCVFNNESWTPIQWTRIQHSKADFKDMGTSVVYLAALFSSRELSPLGPLIFLDSNGKQHFIVPDTVHRTTVLLKRKYPVFDWWNTRMLAMKNGYFQLSNDEQFTHAVTVYRIRNAPGMSYETIHANNNKAYRYFRYVSPDSSDGEVAEIAVFDQHGNKLKGRAFSTEPYSPKYDASMVFDSDPLSFFSGKNTNGNWVGLAFDKPEVVDKIEFLCRNDDNSIRDGELYELYYWLNGDWKSLGRQVGKEAQGLVFKNVPQKALLLLRDHTKGKEERIFTYEAGKQVWW